MTTTKNSGKNISFIDINENKIDSYKNKGKWLKIYDMTLSNYSNMYKRIKRREKFSKFVLIYYSICLIIYSITAEFFESSFSAKLSNYFGIILSVIVLVYSIINNNSRYPERISKIENSMNAIKSIKRDLANEELEKNIVKYNKVCDNTEVREDIDFLNTVKQMCHRNGLKWWSDLSKINIKEDETGEREKIVEYLSDINRFYEQARFIFEHIWYIIVLTVPCIIFFVCFIYK